MISSRWGMTVRTPGSRSHPVTHLVSAFAFPRGCRGYTRPVLIGRQSERQALERLISAARIGQSGVLLITGEPGVGKTALLEDAVGKATGMGVLRAVGSESEREVPFGGLLQLLRPALDLLDQLPTPQADALAVALAMRPGTAGDRFAVGAATLSLICRYAEERPVAIVIDDLHLLDRPSAEAVAFAAHRLMADPIVLLATARSSELTDVEADLRQLSLTGISTAEAGELVSAHSSGNVSPALILRLHKATAGNPLALIELAGDIDRLERASPEMPFPVSEALARAYSERVGGLSEAAGAALVVVAAAGGDLRIVGRACDALRLDQEGLAEAEAAGLLRVVDDRVKFRHPLIRSAVYGDAAPELRRRVHRAVAESLPPEDVDRRAWHLAESVLGVDRTVADLLAQAAARARSRSAHAVASAAFERASSLSPDQGDRVGRCVAAADCAWLAGAGSRASALLDRADDLAGWPAADGLPELRLRALELRGAIAVRTGSLVEARDILRAAAGEAATADATVLLLADAINACYYLGDATSALAVAQEIEGMQGEISTVLARSLGATAIGVARILANAGGVDQLRAAIRLLVPSNDLRDDERRFPWLMVGPLFLRDSVSGAELRKAVDDVRRRAAVGVLPFMLFHVARDEATTDRWTRAEATYTEAIRLARETGQSTDLAMSLAGLAWLLAPQGRAEECRAAIVEGMRICLARDIHLGRIWLLFAMGELEVAAGNPIGAAAHFEELDDLLRELGIDDPDLSPAPDLVGALIRTGRTDQATRVAHAYQSRALKKGRPWACARAERAIGLVSPDSDIDVHFAAALEFHAQTLDGYEAARTRLAYGERLRRARRRLDARPHLRSALATFEKLRATRWAELSAAELEATGESVPRREPSDVAVLTPQELQISLLLAEGRTTREVAAALFLSPKTVEYHLRKVYTKLGIRSRAELAAALPH